MFIHHFCQADGLTPLGLRFLICGAAVCSMLLPRPPRAFCHQWSGVGFLQAEPRAPAATLIISSCSVPTGYCGDQPEEHETLCPVQLTFAPLSSRSQASPQQIRTDLVSQP